MSRQRKFFTIGSIVSMVLALMTMILGFISDRRYSYYTHNLDREYFLDPFLITNPIFFGYSSASY